MNELSEKKVCVWLGADGVVRHGLYTLNATTMAEPNAPVLIVAFKGGEITQADVYYANGESVYVTPNAGYIVPKAGDLKVIS